MYFFPATSPSVAGTGGAVGGSSFSPSTHVAMPRASCVVELRPSAPFAAVRYFFVPLTASAAMMPSATMPRRPTAASTPRTMAQVGVFFGSGSLIGGA